MYYEKTRNNSFGIILILAFLIVIIVILVNLINRLDNNNNNTFQKTAITEETGTDTVLMEFNLENLVENVSYSVVRNFKVESK